MRQKEQNFLSAEALSLKRRHLNTRLNYVQGNSNFYVKIVTNRRLTCYFDAGRGFHEVTLCICLCHMLFLSSHAGFHAGNMEEDFRSADRNIHVTFNPLNWVKKLTNLYILTSQKISSLSGTRERVVPEAVERRGKDQ